MYEKQSTVESTVVQQTKYFPIICKGRQLLVPTVVQTLLYNILKKKKKNSLDKILNLVVETIELCKASIPPLSLISS